MARNPGALGQYEFREGAGAGAGGAKGVEIVVVS